MISLAVIPPAYDYRMTGASPLAKGVIEKVSRAAQSGGVLNTHQILAALEERGVRNVEIARTLGLHETRATEIRKGRRRLLHDEAVKLVETFDLEGERERQDPLPPQVSRLAVLHILKSIGATLPDDQLQDLAADISALAALAAEPGVREAVDGLEMFLNGLTIRRRPAEPAPASRQASNQ